MKNIIKLLLVVIVSFIIGVFLIKMYEKNFIDKPAIKLLEKPYFQLQVSGINDYMSENHNFFMLIIKEDISDLEDQIINTVNEFNLSTVFIVLDARTLSSKENKEIEKLIGEDKLKNNYLVKFSDEEDLRKLEIKDTTGNELIRGFLVKGIVEND